MMAVAERAGVSHQTVSRVLNQPETVRPATRERVVAAMKELGYSRNLAARALVTQQTALLGVMWTGASYLGPSSTVGGIEVAARAAGYSTLVGALEEFDEDIDGDGEELGYAADEAYEQLTGVVAPDLGIPPQPAEPIGTPFDFDDDAALAQRFPKLWERFGTV